jgi:hypothetical protein
MKERSKQWWHLSERSREERLRVSARSKQQRLNVSEGGDVGGTLSWL